jgi:hypothetical protein
MRNKDYSTLKAASKVAFSKVTEDGQEVIKLTEKSYDKSTGTAKDDVVHDVRLAEYESEKVRLTAEKARITKEITQLGKIITDIKAL